MLTDILISLAAACLVGAISLGGVGLLLAAYARKREKIFASVAASEPVVMKQPKARIGQVVRVCDGRVAVLTEKIFPSGQYEIVDCVYERTLSAGDVVYIRRAADGSGTHVIEEVVKEL